MLERWLYNLEQHLETQRRINDDLRGGPLVTEAEYKKSLRETRERLKNIPDYDCDVEDEDVEVEEKDTGGGLTIFGYLLLFAMVGAFIYAISIIGSSDYSASSSSARTATVLLFLIAGIIVFGTVLFLGNIILKIFKED